MITRNHLMCILFGCFFYTLLTGCGQEDRQQNEEMGMSLMGSPNEWQTDTVSKRENTFTHPYITKAEVIEKDKGMDAAFPYYQTAFNLFKEEDNYRGMMVSSTRLGLYFLEENKYDTAFYFLEKSRILGVDHNDTTGLFFSENQELLGDYYNAKDETLQALDFYHRALNNRKQVFGENNIKLANIQLKMGLLFAYDLGDYKSAHKKYEDVIRIQLASKDENYDSLIFSYYYLASAKRQLEDSEGAIIYINRALEIARLQPEINRHKMGLCYNALANIHNDRNEFSKAEQYYHEAIEVSDEGEPYRFTYYNGLGVVYMALKEYDRAFESFKQSYRILKELEDDDKEMEARYMGNLGLYYTELENYDSAYFYLKKSLDLYIEEDPQNLVGNTALAYEYLGDYFNKKEQFDSACYNYQLGIILLNDQFDDQDYTKNPSFQEDLIAFDIFSLITRKARSLKLLYDKVNDVNYLKASLDAYLLSDKILGSLREEKVTDESFFNLTENYLINRVEQSLDCAHSLYKITGDYKYLEIAYQFLENNKYMVLFETIIKNENARLSEIPEELADQEKELQVQLAYYKSKSQDLDQENENYARELNQLNIRIFNTVRKQEELIGKIKEDYPGYFQLKYDSINTSLEEVQNYLDDNGHLLQYYIGKQQIFILKVSPDEISMIKVVRPDNLDYLINTYSNEISANTNVTDVGRFNQYVTSASELFDILIRPLNLPLDHSDGKLSLTVIPHGEISMVPFGPLLNQQPEKSRIDYKSLDYLIKSASVNYAYSANLLLKFANSANRNNQADILAFGYGESNDEKMTSLHGSTREIANISKYLNVTHFEGDNATESNFKNEVSNFNILHLAVHGSSDSSNLYENILMFQNANDTIEDGQLHAYELRNLPIKSNLVVLSACETGIGKQVHGEGVFSMARGFAIAGCPSIIMSYWKVKDIATAEIMDRFYANLSEGVSINESLSNAKLMYINQSDEYSAHPSSWAAFVSLGHSENILFKPKNAITSQVITFLVILSFLIVFLLYRKRKQRLI